MFGVAGLRIRNLPRSLLSSGSGRERLSYGVWAACWLAGHVMGGAVLGAILGWLGQSVNGLKAPMLGIALLCLAYGFHHLGVLRLPMPHWPRQVQRGWMLRHSWNLVAFGYGLQLGSAVATRITTAAVYPMLAIAILSGSPARGALMLGVFGGARSFLPIALGPWAHSPVESLGFAVRLDAYQDRVSKLNGAVLLAAFVLIADAALRTVDR